MLGWDTEADSSDSRASSSSSRLFRNRCSTTLMATSAPCHLPAAQGDLRELPSTRKHRTSRGRLMTLLNTLITDAKTSEEGNLSRGRCAGLNSS